MFNRSNFEQLSEAIELYTKKEDLSLKVGLKQNLYYLIKKICNSCAVFILLKEERQQGC